MLSFYFTLFFSELKEEGKDPAQTSILNQVGISFFVFHVWSLCLRWQLRSDAFDWSVKRSPLASLLRLWIKTSRQDAGEDRTGEGAGSCSMLSGLWWQSSSRDKRAPPSWAEIKTGNVSLGLVPGKEPRKGARGGGGSRWWGNRRERSHKPALSSLATCRDSSPTPILLESASHLSLSGPSAVGTPGSQPLLEFSIQGAWQPDPHLPGFSLSSLCLYWPLSHAPVSTCAPTSLGTNHYQTGLHFVSLLQCYFFCWVCLSSTSACRDPIHPSKPSSNITSSKMACSFNQQCISLICPELPSPCTWILGHSTGLVSYASVSTHPVPHHLLCGGRSSGVQFILFLTSDWSRGHWSWKWP